MAKTMGMKHLRIPQEQARKLMQDIKEPFDGTISLFELLENNIAALINLKLSTKDIYEKLVENGISLENYNTFAYYFDKIRKNYLKSQKTNRAEA